MTNDRFNFLVNEVVTKNGTGHKLLASLVDTQEISKLDETKILIAAQIVILNNKIDNLCSLLE